MVRGAAIVALIVIAAGCSTASSPSTPPVTLSVTIAPSASGEASIAAGKTPATVAPFTTAGIAHVVDAAAHAADPSTFETQVPEGSHFVYVVFALKKDTIGIVRMDMSSLGSTVLEAPLSLDYGKDNSWGHFDIEFKQGIPKGAYEATLTFAATGEKVLLTFTVP